MSKNVKIFDRIIRFISGIILLTWAIAGGPTWTFVGLLFLVTASFGSCPIYWLLRINSRS
ncbi:MAG: hypothetical protein A2Z20_04655 [Bdellovibrionales bacterium RBG_16_40_8]|nr:MAG: hypothetical protein A2Z20_04655 [Bdellovibrionales bacterium RBG_16_40_8]